MYFTWSSFALAIGYFSYIFVVLDTINTPRSQSTKQASFFVNGRFISTAVINRPAFLNRLYRLKYWSYTNSETTFEQQFFE